MYSFTRYGRAWNWYCGKVQNITACDAQYSNNGKLVKYIYTIIILLSPKDCVFWSGNWGRHSLEYIDLHSCRQVHVIKITFIALQWVQKESVVNLF